MPYKEITLLARNFLLFCFNIRKLDLSSLFAKKTCTLHKSSVRRLSQLHIRPINRAKQRQTEEEKYPLSWILLLLLPSLSLEKLGKTVRSSTTKSVLDSHLLH